MQIDQTSFYDQDTLLERLTTGVRRSQQEVVFLVGSPITAPVHVGDRGVPGVQGVIELIRAEFEHADQRSDLQNQLDAASNKYQAAFSFLLGRRGQQVANEIIKRAVWEARLVVPTGIGRNYAPSVTTSD